MRIWIGKVERFRLFFVFFFAFVAMETTIITESNQSIFKSLYFILFLCWSYEIF